MRKVVFAVLSVVLGAALTGPAAAGPDAQPASESVLVRLAGPRPALALDRLLGQLDAAGEEPNQIDAYDTIPWVALEVERGAVAILERSSSVLEVVPDQRRTVELGSTTTIIGSDQVNDAGFEGTGTYLAVLDTGVDVDHPFISGRPIIERCYSRGADCPDGSTTQVGPGSGRHCTYATACDHGTHVAGIALGADPAGARASGVAPGSGLLAVQVFSDTGDGTAGAYDSDILAALDWLNQQAASGMEIAAVNLSLGGSVHYSSNCDAEEAQYKTMFDSLRTNGVAPVVAAGNGKPGNKSGLSSPACVSSAVSVAATTDSGTLADYSNTSSYVSLSAPGSAVTSSVPGSAYDEMSGTSMAAPHVAGAFALLRGAAPSAGVDATLTVLRDTGVAVTEPHASAPRIDVLAAASSLAVVPASPHDLGSAVSNGSVTLSWAAPAWSGSSPVTGYEITWDENKSVTTTELTETITGLTNGTGYTFSVVAVNDQGSSAPTTVTATPATVPAAPSITGVTGGNGRATVTWAAAEDTGGTDLTGFRVTTTGGEDPPGVVEVDASLTAATVTGLTNGTAYTLTVEALNAAGSSPASAASDPVTPAPTVPGSPTSVSAVAGQNLATVSWVAPDDDGGSGELTYRVEVEPATVATVTGASSPLAVSGLTAGTAYTFTVVAANDLGDSAPSPASNPVTPSAPSPAGGGGGGGGAPAPAPVTTTTTSTTTTTAPPVTSTPPTTVPPDPATTAAPAPAVAVSGGVVTIRDGAAVLVRITAPAGLTVAAAAATPSGRGAWVASPEGRVVASGDAPALGSIQGPLNKPIVGMAATASGRGYWLLGADGGVFSFGDARFHGSTGDLRLNQPLRSMATTATGRGYWLLASDGGVFTFGDARFHGSTGNLRLNQPVTSMAPTPTGRGYWLVARDGGVFTFGDAPFAGAGGGGRAIAALAPTTTGRGYFLLAADGTALPFGDAVRH